MGAAARSLHDGAAHHRAQTYQQAARFVKVSDSRTEMRVQRLQWYQEIARHPSSNRLLLIAVYGEFGFEQYQQPSHSFITVVEDDMRIFWEWHPEQEQDALQEIDRPCCLLEIIKSAAATATFTSGDPSVLRQSVLMHASPPPGYVDVAHLARVVGAVGDIFTVTFPSGMVHCVGRASLHPRHCEHINATLTATHFC